MLDPYANVGPATYRYALYAVGEQVVVVVQKRCWFFFWRDWALLSNDLVATGNEILATYDRLGDLVEKYNSMVDDRKEAIEYVKQYYAGDGKSKPFPGPKRPKMSDLPDNSKAVKEVLEAYKKGTKDGQRLGYDYSRLERRVGAKPEEKGGANTGPRTVAIPEELERSLGALSRSHVASTADFKIPWKGLNQPEQKGRNQQPNQQKQKGGGNNNQPVNTSGDGT